jgi:hypothetical protein
VWLDQPDHWKPVFQGLAVLRDPDLLKAMLRFELLTQAQLGAVDALHRSAEGRAVPIPGVHEPSDEMITILAAGFARGEVSAPAIPYACIGSAW